MAIKLNLKTRDLEFDKNKHVMIANKSEDIQQRLTLKVELMKSEWYLNKEEGIDWKTIFSLTGKEQEEMAKQKIKEVLTNDKSVINIKEINAKQNTVTNNLNISFTVLCTDSNEYTIELLKKA